MFVVHPICEMFMQAPILTRDERSFSLLKLALRQPWFIVNMVVGQGSERMPQSFCCVWDEDLADLCAPAPHRIVTSVQQVVSCDVSSGRWQLRDVLKVSRAIAATGDQIVVLEDREGQRFTSTPGSPPFPAVR
jgi:hypothetical protein